MSIIIAMVLYILIGFIGNIALGWIGDKILKKKWNMQKDDDFERELNIAHLEEVGHTMDDFTYSDWIKEVLIWPYVYFCAIKGLIKLCKRTPGS